LKLFSLNTQSRGETHLIGFNLWLVSVQNFSHSTSLDESLEMSRIPRTITSNKEVFKCCMEYEDRNQQQRFETTCLSTYSAVPEINRHEHNVLQRGVVILRQLWHSVTIIVSVFKGWLHLWLFICAEPAGRDLTACWGNSWYVTHSDICKILRCPGLKTWGKIQIQHVRSLSRKTNKEVYFLQSNVKW
jgi:hypothetical protein